MIGPNSQCWLSILDRGLDDNCGAILASYIDPKIAPDYRPTITARVDPPTFQIYSDIINDIEIWNLAYQIQYYIAGKIPNLVSLFPPFRIP